jgi:DNA-binding transcriptional LysR family regulator
MNLNDLQTFSIVAQMGTISSAAIKIGVPKSTVSRRVRRLEDSFGVELLRRSPNSVTLTEDGLNLHKRVSSALRQLLDAEDAFKETSTQPFGVLRITTTHGYGHSPSFVKCIADYGLKYPKITIDLELTNRVVDLVKEDIDIGFRLYTGAVPGDTSTMARQLRQFSLGIFASPAYIEEKGEISDGIHLRNHRFIAHSSVSFRNKPWMRNGVKLQHSPIFPEPQWLVNDSTILRKLALKGAGLAIMDTHVSQSFVDNGELIRILPELELLVAKVSIVWPSSRHLSPKVRTFIDHSLKYLSGP